MVSIDDVRAVYQRISAWALPVLIALLAITVFTCNKEKDERGHLSEALDAQSKRTNQIVNQNGLLVAQNQKLLTSDRRELKDYTDSIFNLKRQNSRLVATVSDYTRIIQEAKFRDKNAGYTDKPQKDPNDTTKIVYLPQPADPDLIRVPRSFAYSDSTINFEGTVLKERVRVDSITIPNTLHIRTVENKTGFLRLGRTTTVQAFNTNPAFTNKELVSVTVKPKKNTLGKIAIAVAAGFLGFKAGQNFK